MENRTEHVENGIDRARVDSFKKIIQEQKVFELTGDQRNIAAAEVVGHMGIVGVDNIDGLLNKTQDGSVNQEVARKNIRDLGTAIGESIMESGDDELKKAVTAGSFSTEKLLPEPWQGRGEFEDGDFGLSGVICESFVDKGVINKTKAETIQRNMEAVDFFKNNPEYSNLLPGQVESSITELRALINPLSKSEMTVISDRLKYLQDLKVVEIKQSEDRKGDERTKRNEGEKKPFKTRAGAELHYASGDFPEKDDKEGWLKYVEERLDVIENFKTNSIKDLALSDFTYPLMTMLAKRDGNVPEHILNIISTRLTLKEIGNRMAANSGSMDEHNGLVRCLVDVESNGFDMGPQVMEYFFKNKIDGLKTAEAWDLMEASNFRYVEMCNEALRNGSENIRKKITEMGGEAEFLNFTKLSYTKGTWLEGQVRNYFLDTNGHQPRAGVLREYLIEKLIKQAEAKGEKLSDYQARKSMQLAEFMYDATLESSVVDWDFVSGDEYAEAVNLGFLRILDGATGSKGKATGPRTSVRQIESLTPGWVRSFSGIERPNKEITAEEIVKYGLEGKGRDRKSGLSGKELYTAHFISIISKKVWPARRLILSEETPLPKDVLKTNYFQGVNDYFNKVDTQVGGNGVPKTAWLTGLIELTLTGRDTSWTYSDYMKLKEIVTKDTISGEGDNKPRAFVTKEEWEKIEKTLDYKKMVNLMRTANIITTIIGGGGSKKR